MDGIPQKAKEPEANVVAGCSTQWNHLVAASIIRPAMEGGDPLEDWPDIRLPPGKAAALIDSDRSEQ
jgi:hypothetical protein